MKPRQLVSELAERFVVMAVGGSLMLGGVFLFIKCFPLIFAALDLGHSLVAAIMVLMTVGACMGVCVGGVIVGLAALAEDDAE